jgi:hypothetical protein
MVFRIRAASQRESPGWHFCHLKATISHFGCATAPLDPENTPTTSPLCALGTAQSCLQFLMLLFFKSDRTVPSFVHDVSTWHFGRIESCIFLRRAKINAIGDLS